MVHKTVVLQWWLLSFNFRQMALQYKIKLLNPVLMDSLVYTGLDVCRNHVIIFGSFLVILENAEWFRFLAHPVLE